MVDGFQAKNKTSKDISSIADMQAFVESPPPCLLPRRRRRRDASGRG